MVRRGWLENGPGKDKRRGRDTFVAMPWDEVLDRLAAELVRVRDTHGPTAIYGGSYGWASAGASIMPRARCTASSTSPWAVTSARSIPTVPARRR